jgi:hypothetical protein
LSGFWSSTVLQSRRAAPCWLSRSA